MSQSLLGAPRDRVDGPAKVTGRAVYTGDNAVTAMVHAVVVESRIANGRITTIDEAAARSAAGVIEIMTHLNAPRVNARKSNANDSLLFLLQGDTVEFDRQPVAVAIAETFEQAMHAAQLVRVTYEAHAPTTDLALGARFVPEQVQGEPALHRRGSPEDAFAQAAVKAKQTYRTPTEHHNPMETHGTVAQWIGDRLTLYDSTQGVFGVQSHIATMFGIDPTHVRVVAPFVGGAFGSKGQMWSHVPLAAMAAKLVKRPVKLLLTRPQMFGWVGHRPQTAQAISLAATRDGRLQSVTHDVVNETSISDEFVEPCAVFSRDLYAVPNYAMSHTLARLHISKPTYQRGPGESTGSFAMESAMDELSYALGLDPLELRLRNYSDDHPDSGKPYSSKRLRECYARASERFGWSTRNPNVRSTSRGRMLVGAGMATASRAVHRSAATVRIRMNADGCVVVQCGTIEQGTGSPTVFGQLAAEILEIAPDRVRFEWGNTDLPEAPLAAGSQTAASVGSAVVAAARRLRERLASTNGSPPAEGVEVQIEDKPAADEEAHATQSFGAHFAEVEVDPDVGTVRVAKFVGAFDGGRILNAKTAQSQLLGGIVWGISMALFEDTRYDARTGRIMNANLSEYLVPTNADIPDVDVIIVEGDDPFANPAGVKGIGEVGICGSAAAVANAVYHATGIRIRELPITPDKLLA
jgi:xanthine dehydrogenase YagR molybdenum-binding subunit